MTGYDYSEDLQKLTVVHTCLQLTPHKLRPRNWDSQIVHSAIESQASREVCLFSAYVTFISRLSIICPCYFLKVRFGHLIYIDHFPPNFSGPFQESDRSNDYFSEESKLSEGCSRTVPTNIFDRIVPTSFSQNADLPKTNNNNNDTNNNNMGRKKERQAPLEGLDKVVLRHPLTDNVRKLYQVPLEKLNCSFGVVTKAAGTNSLRHVVRSEGRLRAANVTIVFAIRRPG